MPTRATAMMLLFVSTENPLWQDLISGDITETEIAEYIAVTRTTISNWKRGGPIGKRGTRDVKVRARKDHSAAARYIGGRLDDLVFERVRNIIEGIDTYHRAAQLDDATKGKALAADSNDAVRAYRT